MCHTERCVQAADKTSHYSRLHLYLIRDRFSLLSFEIKMKLFRGESICPTTNASLGCSPTMTHLFWAVFTGLALATSWRQIKAAKRTTNSRLITPSFVFYKYIRYKLGFYCSQAGEDEPRRSTPSVFQMWLFFDGKC